MKHYIAFVLLGVLNTARTEDFEMTILHNNDMHARFEETKESIDGRYIGGFARTATVIKTSRREAEMGKSPPVIYLNAGDTYTGTIWFSVHRWKIAVEFLNALEPNVTCLGNHEFDDGAPSLASFLKGTKFPVLAANIDFRNETDIAKYVKPSVVLDVNGKKVGVIGYLTPETKIMATVSDIVFEDEVVAITRESKRLKREGVNIIIALGHSGFKMDRRIASEVSDVDIVVGGHTNTFLWNGDPPDAEKPVDAYPSRVVQKNGKIVPVVQEYAYTKYMGKLHVTFDEEGDLKRFEGQPIFLDEKIPQDPDILNLLEKFRPDVESYNLKIVGKSRSFLDGESCRRKECNFGNVVADAFVDYVTAMYKTPYWTTASISLVNGGSVRMSINASAVDKNITAGDILGAVPFRQQLVTVDLTGKDLIATLELGARSNGETSSGEFLQVSGLKVVYDFSKPSRDRVVSVKARCARCYVPTYSPVHPDEYYRVVTTQFLLNGGDGHIVLRDKSQNVAFEDMYDAGALERYFAFYQIVTPQEEERIVVFNQVSTQPSGGRAIYLNKIAIVVLIGCIYMYR